MTEALKISIVTVCLNAMPSIERTLDSVTSQTCGDIEHVIIDGGSTDGTLSVLKRHEEEHGYVRVFSDKDEGIYDAMNRGVSHCTGDYVFFLNSGDLFYDEKTVECVARVLRDGMDILYGNVDYEYSTGTVHRDYASRRQMSPFFMAAGITVCHQAVFTKTSLLKEHPFDTSYTLWADQEFLAWCLHGKAEIKTYGRTICTFDPYGFSYGKDRKDLSRRECDRIVKAYFPGSYLLFFIPKFLVRFFDRPGRQGEDV